MSESPSSTRLESIDGSNWQAFTASPVAVLMLGKTDCAACSAWTDELTAALSDSAQWSGVRFGKMLLNQRGLIDFKRANQDWLSEVSDLPYTVIYKDGAVHKRFPGGGVERLDNRLKRIAG